MPPRHPQRTGPIAPTGQPVPFDLLFSNEEFEAVLLMMQKAGLSTVSGVVNVALWNFARHLDLDLPTDLFDAGRHARKP